MIWLPFLAVLPLQDAEWKERIARRLLINSHPVSAIAFMAAWLAAPQDGVEWAADWEAAARRAAAEKKLVIVTVELYDGISLKPQLPYLFLDPDLEGLARTRFVPLQWKAGMRAPFQNPAVYGMAGPTFGAAILFATPDGKIVGQVSTTNPAALDVYARGVLEKCPEFTGAPVDAKDTQDRVDAYLKRGELLDAARLLQQPDGVRGWRLKSQLHRRLRQGAEALAAIRKARELDAGASEPELMAEEATILLRTGKIEEAEKLFTTVMEKHAASPLAPSAAFTLARLRARADPKAAKTGLEGVLKKFPQSPWASLAGLVLASGPIERLAESRTDWPTEAMLDSIRDRKPDPLPAGRREDAERGAAAFLVKTQQGDGSWISPYQLTARATTFVVATTAICGSSLLPRRERREVGAAVDRALKYVLAPGTLAALDREASAAGFDYTPWGRGFALRFLDRCLLEKVGDPDAVLRAMNGLIESLSRQQTGGGGWSYYGQREASFTTAAILLALVDAKNAGAAVSDPMIAKAAASLQKLDQGNGAFGYMAGSRSGDSDASLRAPLCSLALRRAGPGSVEAVRAGLDLYLKYHAQTRKERGKALCHTAPDGTAAYFLLFGYSFAAEALGELKPADRGAYRDALLEDVLQSRMDDGSFQDFPPVGRSYGTGQALSALLILAPR